MNSFCIQYAGKYHKDAEKIKGKLSLDGQFLWGFYGLSPSGFQARAVLEVRISFLIRSNACTLVNLCSLETSCLWSCLRLWRLRKTRERCDDEEAFSLVVVAVKKDPGLIEAEGFYGD